MLPSQYQVLFLLFQLPTSLWVQLLHQLRSDRQMFASLCHQDEPPKGTTSPSIFPSFLPSFDHDISIFFTFQLIWVASVLLSFEQPTKGPLLGLGGWSSAIKNCPPLCLKPLTERDRAPNVRHTTRNPSMFLSFFFLVNHYSNCCATSTSICQRLIKFGCSFLNPLKVLLHAFVLFRMPPWHCRPCKPHAFLSSKQRHLLFQKVSWSYPHQPLAIQYSRLWSQVDQSTQKCGALWWMHPHPRG